MELASMQLAGACDFVFSLERMLECDCYRAGDGVHAAWLRRRSEFEPALKTWWRNRRDKHHEILRLEETMFRGESARAVIANSRMVKEEIIEEYGYPRDRIHVVHNGVPAALSEEDSAKAREEVRKELGLDRRDYVLLFAGGGWERKGLRYAIEAVNEAAVAGPTLLVAGQGSRWRMPSSSRVCYLGPTPNLSRLLAAADVFILPSLYDPFSNACLEAMAAGLPVITTSANGFAEIIEKPAEGEAISDPRDVLALARAIEEWASPERRAEVRGHLREKGVRYSMEENLRATIEIIEQVRGPAWALAKSEG